MTRVLILGANGQIARYVVRGLAHDDNISMTLFVRDAGKLPNTCIVQGDVLNHLGLDAAMEGQNLVDATGPARI